MKKLEGIDVAAVQAEAERDLMAAEPVIAAAEAALNSLNKASLTELKAFGSPADDVVMVTAACLVLTAGDGKAAKAPYKAVDDWTDHSGTKIKKGDFVIDLIYWDRPSTDDPLLFEDEAKKATVHAEHVLHANVAPTAAADDRVRVSEAVVAEIEAEYEVFLNT